VKFDQALPQVTGRLGVCYGREAA